MISQMQYNKTSQTTNLKPWYVQIIRHNTSNNKLKK